MMDEERKNQLVNLVKGLSDSKIETLVRRINGSASETSSLSYAFDAAVSELHKMCLHQDKDEFNLTRASGFVDILVQLNHRLEAVSNSQRATLDWIETGEIQLSIPL